MSEQERLCRVVQPILRWGMMISLALMLVGLALGIATGAEGTEIVPLEDIPSGLVEMDPLAFLTLGILLLIITPLARVFGALSVFLKERDRQFVLVSIAVLLAVTVAVLLGTI
ncbi:MAG: DUF1634 domain-containing protein [Methanomassiliicoccales archaeon]|nr:DUF1634 domain-containing protein [Methanomassiliicoccales archaeon]